jgi:hypothetical protein
MQTTRAIKTNDSRGWLVGKARPDYTLLDFDGNDNVAYFKAVNPSNDDGAITRFNKSPVLFINQDIESDISLNFVIFPNPSNDVVNISLKNNFTNASIQVFDGTGRVIFEKAINSNTEVLDIKEWANGVYSLVVNLDGLVASKLFIKQ